MVICDCGRRFTEVNQLVDVHSVGLKLCGTCPACGAQLVLNRLWHKVASSALERHSVAHQLEPLVVSQVDITSEGR